MVLQFYRPERDLKDELSQNAEAACEQLSTPLLLL